MDKVQLFDREMLAALHGAARGNERLRQIFDLRTTPEDGSQRMLNALEPGTRVPIHRHLHSSETVVCLEGCMEEVFFEELPNMDAGGPVHDGERAVVENCFTEVARFRICPREGTFGMQIPKMAWHTVEVLEPSTTLETKDGAFGK